MSSVQPAPAPDRRADPDRPEHEPPPRPVRRDVRWALLAIVTSAFCLAASTTLVAEKIIYLENPDTYSSTCDLNAVFSCSTVFTSPQASLFGFPNPYIGFAGYAVVITIAMAVLAGARLRPWFWRCLLAGLVLGEVFLLWLWTQATFEINALCLYCMIVWFFHPLLLAATVRRCAQDGTLPGSASLRRTLAAGWWFMPVLIWIIVFGAVLVRFASTMFG